ncbi:transcriptional repressor TraM [Neorhizobium sp. T25_13]|uniref:transcriptional repressor TraM n=1 Tax=Neorhizobium sp. T25_13 TaxID=2093830 RepID=UPI000CFA5267|nr:transcriptional repressor TraM [Neorhizobium sp. T25_13]
MNDTGSSRYSSMQQSELEVLAVAAIREHRHLMAADEVVYEEWTRASDDPSVSAAVLKSLQDEYVARQKKSEAQQEALSKIIDALGYVPVVAPDDEE